MVRWRVRVNLPMLRIHTRIMVNGKEDYLMDLVNKLLIIIPMKVNLSMEKNMGKGYFIIKMEVTIRGILKII
jgi:hypothetical protein